LGAPRRTLPTKGELIFDCTGGRAGGLAVPIRTSAVMWLAKSPERRLTEKMEKRLAIRSNRRHVGFGSAVSERRLHAVEG